MAENVNVRKIQIYKRSAVEAESAISKKKNQGKSSNNSIGQTKLCTEINENHICSSGADIGDIGRQDTFNNSCSVKNANKHIGELWNEAI